jgi:hypothetical protein
MTAVPNAVLLAQVLRTATQIHHVNNVTATDAIISAIARHTTDNVEADTFANAAVSYLAGQWRTPQPPNNALDRLRKWEAACSRETVAMMIRLAAAEADWLAGGIGAAAVPSPLAQAEQAKRRRDLPGEIAAVQAGQRALETAPWYPARAGDLVHVHYYGSLADMTPEMGETYVVENSEDEGGLVLRLLHHTADFEGAGCFAPGMVDAPLMEAWFEAGPDALTIVRDGRVVHGGTR